MKIFLKKYTKYFFTQLTFLLVLPLLVQAGQTVQSPFLSNTGAKLLNNAGFTDASDKISTDQQGKIAEQIGDFINIILQFLGVLILLFILYAGFLWLTAGGNEDKVARAKKYLTNAVIGALIIGIAYSVTAFILFITQR